MSWWQSWRQDSKSLDESETVNTSDNIHRNKILSAIFYGVCSVAVIFTNKAIMTQFNFPYFDFLAAVQFLATSIVLFILILMKRIDVPNLNFTIFREILPVSLMFLGNVICGLGSTKSLNLPMFTALRRFSIFMTMTAEYCFLSTRPSSHVVFSVLTMVGGAFLAAIYDLSFDPMGYTLVFLNNLFTALNGVWMKKASMSGKCSKMGVLFYNSLFSAIIMFSFFIIEHNYINRNNIRVENSFVIMKASDASPSLRGITPAAIHAASNRLLSNLNTNNMFSYSILSNLIELYPGSHVGRKLSVESSLLINVPTPKRIIEVSSEQFLISRNDILNQPVKKSTLIKIY